MIKHMLAGYRVLAESALLQGGVSTGASIPKSNAQKSNAITPNMPLNVKRMPTNGAKPTLRNARRKTLNITQTTKKRFALELVSAMF